MQRKDIKTGTVYAFASGSYSGYKPTLVLDTDHMWERKYLREGPSITLRPNAKTPGRIRGYDSIEWGFLAVKGDAWYVGDDIPSESLADQLREWLSMVDDPHTVTPESVAALRKTLPKGFELGPVNNRHLIGEWSAVIADAERADAEAKDARAADEAERNRLVAVHEACGAVWRERFGNDHTYNYDVYRDSVSMPVAALAALLGVDPK
jgi:hypothetical protein